jgi:hypothetical protein
MERAAEYYDGNLFEITDGFYEKRGENNIDFYFL